MDFFQDLSPDDSMQVCFHKIENQIKILIIFCLDDVQKFHDIIMPIQFLQEHHLFK